MGNGVKNSDVRVTYVAIASAVHTLYQHKANPAMMRGS
jgi:hypothetical protein